MFKTDLFTIILHIQSDRKDHFAVVKKQTPISGIVPSLWLRKKSVSSIIKATIDKEGERHGWTQ